VDCIATAQNVEAVRNSDRVKTIMKAEDFVKSKNLRRRLRKSENIAEVQTRTSIINVFACIWISN